MHGFDALKQLISFVLSLCLKELYHRDHFITMFKFRLSDSSGHACGLLESLPWAGVGPAAEFECKTLEAVRDCVWLYVRMKMRNFPQEAEDQLHHCYFHAMSFVSRSASDEAAAGAAFDPVVEVSVNYTSVVVSCL